MNSIVASLLMHAAVQPDQTAVIADQKIVTYAELASSVTRAAALLTEMGVARGDRVIVESAHTADNVKLVYGIALCGGVHVPVENGAPPERIAEIARAVQAKYIIAQAQTDTGIPEMTRDAFAARREETAPVSDPCLPGGEEEAEILFTTGTTGKSKGVLLTHDCLAFYARSAIQAVGMTAATRFLVCTPMNHAGGIRRMHMSIANGSAVILLDGLTNVKRFFSYLTDYGVTATYLPPSAVHLLLLLSGQELAKYDGKLEYIYTGSAPYPETDREKLCKLLPGVKLYNGYGGSEIGVVAMYNYNVAQLRKDCIGQPVQGVSVMFIDENDQPIQATHDAPGRICIKSRMNMRAYIGDPALTEKIRLGEYLKTSDIGYMDDEGYLYFAGRGDDVINAGGFKIAPTEVEDAALAMDEIADCACTSVVTPLMGTAVKLLVCVKPGRTLDARAVMNFLKTRLEPYKVPKVVAFIDQVPRTFNGKIDRKRLKQEG